MWHLLPDKTITFFCEKDFIIPLYPLGGLQPKGAARSGSAQTSLAEG